MLDAWRVGGRGLGSATAERQSSFCRANQRVRGRDLRPAFHYPTQDLRRSLAGVRALLLPVESCFSPLSDLSALSSVQPEHLAINAEQVPVGFG
jgi:hypothetical protein